MVQIITLNKYADESNRAWMELYGLSTDEKPIEIFDGVYIGNASTLYLMDTKELWMYSEEDKTWYEM